MLEDFRVNVLKTHPGSIKVSARVKSTIFSKFEIFDVQIKPSESVHLKKRGTIFFFFFLRKVI